MTERAVLLHSIDLEQNHKIGYVILKILYFPESHDFTIYYRRVFFINCHSSSVVLVLLLRAQLIRTPIICSYKAGNIIVLWLLYSFSVVRILLHIYNEIRKWNYTLNVIILKYAYFIFSEYNASVFKLFKITSYSLSVSRGIIKIT